MTHKRFVWCCTAFFFCCQIIDAIVISGSFILDIVFLDGALGTGDETAILLIVFLLWRLIRVINGMYSPAMQPPCHWWLH